MIETEVDVQKNFCEDYDVHDIGICWRALIPDNNISDYLSHKLIRFIGKGSIGKRTPAGRKINEHDLKSNVFVTITAKGKRLLYYDAL